MNIDSPFHTRPTATGGDNQPARQGFVQNYNDKADSSLRPSIQTEFPEPQHINESKVQSTGPLAEHATNAISLAVPALLNSRIWTKHPLVWTEEIKQVSILAADGRAKILNNRLSNAENYLDSAEATWEELCTVREQLHKALDRIASHTRNPFSDFQFKNTLSKIYIRLGDYDRATDLLRSACPSLPLCSSDFPDLGSWGKVEPILTYIQLLMGSGRDLDTAALTAKLLQWARADAFGPWSEDSKSPILFLLIQIFNSQGRHKEALEHLRMYEVILWNRTDEADYMFQKAMAIAGCGGQTEAQALFVDSLTLTSLTLGSWHLQTLDILYNFGRAAKAWGAHESARKLLMHCCKGLFYTLGALHPLSIRAYEELKGYERDDGSLRWLGHSHYGRRRKWSTAYVHNYLITPIELLMTSVQVDFARTAQTVGPLLFREDLSNRASFDAWRSLAWCHYAQDHTAAAVETLSHLYPLTEQTSNKFVDADALRTILLSDEAIFTAGRLSPDHDGAHLKSKLVFLSMSSVPKGRNHQIKAVIKRLTMYDLSHFTHKIVFSDPPLISELNRESLGSGSSATVDSVKVCDKLYARKAINLPNSRQTRHREDIQKEIKVIHALRHPHIVRVLFTYEETRRICIIIHPLAECDLEVYLANNRCETQEQRNVCTKWTMCLVNTLTFIHSREVRHKDIKPRNILVKGAKVYFADFGSCYVFSDSGNSTTEGIAHGHTRAYCAPEVLEHTERRNRSSDVFSLGCILSELTAWSSGVLMSDYFSCISKKPDRDQHQYHDSTKQLKQWFRSSPHVSPQSQTVFTEVIRHMLHKKPEKRWTAVQVSRALRERGPVICEKCCLDLWLDDNE